MPWMGCTMLTCALLCCGYGTSYAAPGGATAAVRPSPDPAGGCPAGLVCLTEPEARELLRAGVEGAADAAAWRALRARVEPPAVAAPCPEVLPMWAAVTSYVVVAVVAGGAGWAVARAVRD